MPQAHLEARGQLAAITPFTMWLPKNQIQLLGLVASTFTGPLLSL